MVFRKGRRYRHRNCIDIDIEVVGVCHVSLERTKLKVKYALQRNSYPLGFSPERVEVKSEHYKNWREVLLSEQIDFSSSIV